MCRHVPGIGAPWQLPASMSRPPNLFAQLGLPGRTMSKRLHGTDTVIDMTLETVSAYLRQHPAVKQGEMYLFKREGQVIASSEALESKPEMPSPPTLSLSQDERTFIARQGVLRIAKSDRQATH